MADPQRLDTVLKTSIAVLLIGILALGGWFGYSVYADRKAAEDAIPAIRLTKILKEQVGKNPNDAVLRVRLGEALGAAGKTQQAIEQFNAALKIEPTHTGAFMDLGIIAMQNGRQGEAKGFFDKVIELTEGVEMADTNQRRELAFHNLGIMALQQKNYEEAIGNFKAALRIRSDASDTYVLLAQALEAIGQTQDAETAVATALRFDPNFAQARYMLGKLYLADGDRLAASEELGRARELAPEAPEPQKLADQIGDPAQLFEQATADAAQNPEAALEAATIAFNLDRSNNIPAAKLAAALLLKTGDKQAALELYRRAAEVAPTDSEISAALKRLTPKPKAEKKS